MLNLYNNIFDTHSHYDDEAFDADRDELISSMLSGSVSYIIHASTDEASSRYGIEYSQKYENYYTSIGFHPENLDTLPDDYIALLGQLLNCSNKIVAVGEIGLDYHYDGYDSEKQKEVFENQLIFANEHNLPVIIHCRDATEDAMSIIRKHRPKGVMHCFSGSAETATELISLGMYIGFTGVLTFKNAKKAVRAIDAIPLDRILFETDCPYMAPDIFRGERSDSTMIERNAIKASEIKGISVQDMLNCVCDNARTLFSI